MFLSKVLDETELRAFLFFAFFLEGEKKREGERIGNKKMY
jgi:hypothetical protein